MQAKKVLDGSKHEYSTDMGWAHRTLQYTIYTTQHCQGGQHHCTICTSDSVPSAPVPRVGARWWSWSRCLESTGRAGLLGWAGPRRVYRQPQPPRPGGEKTQVQTSGWRAAAAAAAGREQRTQSDALRSTRHPPAVQHTPSTPATHGIVSVNCWTTSTTTPSTTPTPPPRPCSCGAETLGARSCPAPARGAALVTETGSGAVSDW